MPELQARLAVLTTNVGDVRLHRAPLSSRDEDQ